LSYDQVNAMLLNEFLKEYATVQQLKSKIDKQEVMIARHQKSFESRLAEQKQQIEILISALQRLARDGEAR
jgi:hypothetical protein